MRKTKSQPARKSTKSPASKKKPRPAGAAADQAHAKKVSRKATSTAAKLRSRRAVMLTESAKSPRKKAARLKLVPPKPEAAGADAQQKNARLRSQPVEVQEIDVQIQRERKSRLEPFTPRSYGGRPKKLKPGELIEQVAKYMGRAPSLSDKHQPKTVVELGVFCIFALGGNSARVSLESTKRLVTSFPEWNEFRVSEAYEFLEVLEGLKVVEPYDRCEQVLEFINEVYQDQNAVDLEFLRDMSPEDRLVALNRYRSLGPALSHYIALGLQGFRGILFHYSWARVVQRVGIVPRSGSPKALVASNSKVFEGLDTVTLQINLIDLGEEICQPKNPQCRNCYLVLGCKSRKI